MKKNISKKDKQIRYLLAILIAVVGLYYKSWWVLLAFIPFITGYINFCPLYKLFGLNTNGFKSVQ